MELNDCKKYVSKKYRGKVRRIVDKQIEIFFDIENSNFKLVKHNYNVGDSVKLNKYNFLHGIGKTENMIDYISQNGILSKESTGNFGNHAFQFVVGLWRVKDKVSLKEYIENYSGIVAQVNDKNWQVPYKQIDEFVEILRDVEHWKWTAKSSMEIRFMPSLARNENQVGFILNLNSHYGKELLRNDINASNFDKDISNKFIKKELRGNYFNNIDNDFLERASYIVFGINKCFIEGILVGRKFESDSKKIEELKNKFPDAYICNLDGIVIRI